MERAQKLSLLPSINEVQNSRSEPLQALLMAEHEQVVTAARLQATAPYGSATSRKRHFAWKAAEAKFAASLARVIEESNG